MKNKTPKSNNLQKSNNKPLTIPPIQFYKKNTKSISPNKAINLKRRLLAKDDSNKQTKTDFLITQSNINQIKMKGNEIRKFENIYSPRTSFLLQEEKEEKLLQDLGKSFDPITIKIMKSFFKERLGQINKVDFIGLLENNLLTWHPELPNRHIILKKLLTKIFEDIDLDNNRQVSWDELINFLMSSSYNLTNKKNYEPKKFIPLKKIIDGSEYTNIVSHAFYIEKYNLIGIVVEGKSYILFYDAETCQKQKAFIDIKETQQKIDIMKYKELEIKAREKLERKEEIKLFKLKNNLNLQKIKGVTTSLDFDIKSFKNSKLNFDMKINKKREETPEKIREEIKSLNSDYFKNNKKDFNKKLTILCTLFVPEYDILFVSSSNNKISAWKYDEKEFKNINILEGNLKDKYDFTCAILDAELPQQTIEWDPIQKILYSGQADGKILMWDIHKSKNLPNSTLDFEVAKKRHDEDIRSHKILNVDEIEVLNDNYDEQTIKGYLSKITDRTEKKNFFEKVEKTKRIKLYGENAFMSNKMDFSLDNVSVGCIKYLEKMQLLAAGYYNGVVILWDTILKEHRKFYTDQKTGIYQIEYDLTKNLIYTCGFDHDIYIYDPYVDSRCVHKLAGHNYSINSIASINSDSEFVSIDIYGNIKLWDLSNYYNYQSINLNETLNLIKIKNNQNQVKKKISSNQKMIYLSKVKKILTFGEKLMMFGMISSKLSDLCDNQLVLGCFYKPLKFNFYTICLKKIKIWSLFNGKLRYIFDNFLPSQNSELTAFCTDKYMKKIFLGDCLGNIICLNLNTGKLLEKFEPQKSEIVSLCHSQKLEILISLSVQSIIKIHMDKDFAENHTIKEFSLENIFVKSLKLNETYSRLIMGTTKDGIKFFDVDHLKLDTAIEQKKKDTKSGDEDPINEIYSFEDYPLCIAFHESGTNIFEIIPPTYYKYRSFGRFNNIVCKDGQERRVKVTACEYNKNNKWLYTGDLFGFIQCYSLVKLIDNIQYLNHNESSKEDIIYLKNLEKFKIEKIFTFEACKEKIKHINYPTINPNIIVITGSDRRVKLFSSEEGTYIDEFKQSSENRKEYPIGLKYYYSDPFVSKITAETELKFEEIYRKDIQDFKTSKIRNEINTMKINRKPLHDYIDNIIKLNAKERLYFLTKNADTPMDKSSSWKYEPNLKIITTRERKLSIIDIKDKLNYEYNPIESKNYYPQFIKYMDHDELKQFSDEVNNKIRKVHLNLAKIKLNNEKYQSYEKNKTRNMNKSFNKRIKLLLSNKYEYKDNNTKKNERNVGKSEKKDNNKNFFTTTNDIKERFDNYKNDFELKFNDLQNMLESRVFHMNNILNDNRKNMYSTIRQKSPNKGLLPKIVKDIKINNNEK